MIILPAVVFDPRVPEIRRVDINEYAEAVGGAR